jgi:aminobenzoyl-glutamate transport protein
MKKVTVSDRALNAIERIGNKLPDPAMLFLASLGIVWALSYFLAGVEFAEIDPRSGEALRVHNLLTGAEFASFLTRVVSVFAGFAPMGTVLVTMLGFAVAEHSGYISAALRMLLGVTPKGLLTPMVVMVGVLSHTAIDAGYVLVIPLGGIIFHAAGRHPLAGIAAAFAGVSGGFGANFIPSGLDPLLQTFTQSSAQLLDPAIEVNPLCNYYFTAFSSFFIVGAGWFITDRIIEPRLADTEVVIEEGTEIEMHPLNRREQISFVVASAALLGGLVLLAVSLVPETSPLRGPGGELSSFSAPIMRSIVPLIFLLAAIPGVIYGFASRSFKNSKDIVNGMSKAMGGMSHYIVMAFFCALFLDAFGKSNLGALMALKGASFLQALALPAQTMIVGIILLVAVVNLFVGSASAKWALIGPIVVPMLMQVGISPELAQAAYRVGDSSSNIITPMNPYFPLVVVFCQRYVKSTGIGTLVSMMLPYTAVYLVGWTLLLLAYWAVGLPLGLQASYVYP